MNRLLLIPMVAICMFSCNGSNQSGDGGIKPEGVEEVEVIEERAEPLTRSEIESFMQRWIKVYNTHTFDTYIDLYDQDRFIGVKRPLNGKKNTYDYAGWIDNKRTEFRKYKPEVYMNDLRITHLNRDGVSKVSFEQIWVSYAGNYADKGEKVMTLRKVDGEIKIVYEELLYSERADEYLNGYEF